MSIDKMDVILKPSREESNVMNGVQEVLAHEIGLNIETVQQAIENLTTGQSVFIGVSGKIGSGKDTVAPILMKILTNNVQQVEIVQEYFAKPLKMEVQQVIDIIREEIARNEEVEWAYPIAVKNVSIAMGIDEQDAEYVVETLFHDIADDEEENIHSYNKVHSVRTVLQYWGTEVRRKQDDNYWVNKAIKAVYEHIANGRSVYVSDVRFPNEADAIKEFLGNVIRLDVSDEEQSRRILARDNVEVTEMARQHSSEVALDSYEKFNARILTDGFSPAEVAEKLANELLSA